MRVIIAGSRDYFPTMEEIGDAVKAARVKPHRILSGGASGVDKAGERWAELVGLPADVYDAEWNLYGKQAGPMRNLRMAENADALIAFNKNGSPGTKSMIDLARRHGLKVFVVNV